MPPTQDAKIPTKAPNKLRKRPPQGVYGRTLYPTTPNASAPALLNTETRPAPLQEDYHSAHASLPRYVPSPPPRQLARPPPLPAVPEAADPTTKPTPYILEPPQLGPPFELTVLRDAAALRWRSVARRDTAAKGLLARPRMELQRKMSEGSAVEVPFLGYARSLRLLDDSFYEELVEEEVSDADGAGEKKGQTRLKRLSEFFGREAGAGDEDGEDGEDCVVLRVGRWVGRRVRVF